MGQTKKWIINWTHRMKILGSKRDQKCTRFMETGEMKHYDEFVEYRNKVKS